MAYASQSNGSNPDPRNVPGNPGADEESEMIERDPAEREVTGRQMDALGESGDEDPLLRPEGEGEAPSARGDTGDPQLPHTHGRREDTAAANEAAVENHSDVARDAEEDRVRPGDRKHGRE